MKTAVVVAACAVAVGALTIVLAVRADQVRCMRVLTGSMRPTVPAGSLVVGTPQPASGVRVGEVVMFVPPPPYRAPGGSPIVHRVYRVSSKHGHRYLTTKGDGNPVADPWLLDADRTTLYRLRWHSLRAGAVLGIARRWGAAAAASLLVVPGWMAGMRGLGVGSSRGRHCRTARQPW
ncbi:MAG: signal peptidase I [Actinomycetes bacterium]